MTSVTNFQILQVIELLVLNELHSFKDGENFAENREKILDMIYRFSHIGTTKSCRKNHKKWIKELEKIYHDFKDLGEL